MPTHCHPERSRGTLCLPRAAQVSRTIFILGCELPLMSNFVAFGGLVRQPFLFA